MPGWLNPLQRYHLITWRLWPLLLQTATGRTLVLFPVATHTMSTNARLLETTDVVY